MNKDLAQACSALLELRQFPGAPKEFWPQFLAAAAQVASADMMVLLLGNPGKAPRWVKTGEWTASAGPSRARTALTSQLEAIAERGLKEGGFIQQCDAGLGSYTVALRLKLARAEDEVILAAQLVDFTEAAARESLVRLGLAADTPALYQLNQAARQARSDVEKFAAVLDLMAPVNEATRFLPAALAFCNGVATRFKCDRASLGWLEGGYIHLRAMSRTERFERQMSAAQALEKAMEECLDQDEELLWPPPEDSSAVTRDHDRYAREQASGPAECGGSGARPSPGAATAASRPAAEHSSASLQSGLAAPGDGRAPGTVCAVTRDHDKFAREQAIEHLCSVPLRVEGKAVAVLTCERQAAAFGTVELQQLRLLCDQASRRLNELKSRDRWFGARWAAGAREYFAGWLGPEHTWSKVCALGTVLVLLALVLVRVEYRVGGNFILRSDEAEYLTAPFDGYIGQVFVRAGDHVQKGGKLLELDRSELLLEESAALADLTRYQRESEKARAAKSLAEMRIADALAQQAQARLDLVRFRLDNAVVKSAYDGVVVEGDLRERVAAPVKQGDALFKVARLDTLYAEAEIPERDVKEILARGPGEIAFVTQPKSKYPVTLQIIEPAAVTRKDGNVFLVRLKLERAPESWWRPGMTGLCKLSVEKRSLLWILTHRTVDFLRLKLWW